MFIARVAYNLFSWHVPPSSCFHGVCRLKVSDISSFRRFQTSFYNVLSPQFLFSSRVSLLGFLNLYSAYPFQAGLFMVFSAPNLVLVVCVTSSLYLASSALIYSVYRSSLLGSFFMAWCVSSFVLMCGASFWSCISHFLYFAVRVFSVCVLLPISCSLSRFYSRSLLLTFSFPQLVPVFGNFLLYFFVCSSML